MVISRLSYSDQVIHGATHKIVVKAADIAALATDTASLALVPTSGTVPIGTTVGDCKIKVTAAWDFSDASINSMLVEVGDGTDPNRFIGQVQVAEDGTEVDYTVANANSQPYTYLAADTIDLTVTVAGGANPTLAECTTGEMEIYLSVRAPFDDLALVAGAL